MNKLSELVFDILEFGIFKDWVKMHLIKTDKIKFPT